MYEDDGNYVRDYVCMCHQHIWYKYYKGFDEFLGSNGFTCVKEKFAKIDWNVNTNDYIYTDIDVLSLFRELILGLVSEEALVFMSSLSSSTRESLSP